MRVCIFNPSRHAGGTTLLLARLALALTSQAGIELEVVDYRGGLTDSLLARNQRRYLLIEHTEGRRHDLAPDLLVSILLHVKLFDEAFRVAPSTRLLFWMTHPYDAFKIFPTFNLATESDFVVRKWMSVVLHPGHRQRLRKFLDLAERGDGLWCMDSQTQESLVETFDVAAPPVVPLLTDVPAWRWTAGNDASGERVCYLGRLEDFKLQAVLEIAGALSRVAMRRRVEMELEVVGSGREAEKVQKMLSGLPGLRTVFRGHLTGEALAAVLKRSSLLVGHGLSILEGASVGLPSLVVDGGYLRPNPGALRVRWFFEEAPGDVGRLLHHDRERRGEPLERKLGSWFTRDGADAIGSRCYEAWAARHDPRVLAPSLVRRLADVAFTKADLDRSGALKLDLLGKIAQATKRLVRLASQVQGKTGPRDP